MVLSREDLAAVTQSSDAGVTVAEQFKGTVYYESSRIVFYNTSKNVYSIAANALFYTEVS